MKGAHENGDACDDESPGGPKALPLTETALRQFRSEQPEQKTAPNGGPPHAVLNSKIIQAFAGFEHLANPARPLPPTRPGLRWLLGVLELWRNFRGRLMLRAMICDSKKLAIELLDSFFKLTFFSGVL